ncbi:MAG TPA: alpha/beta hydrolase, partial [Alcanivorax sp.]|nr:alpha/beta hydrolase [Alcanivorax sp.]
IQFAGKALERMPTMMDDLREVVLLDDLGHWIQMEAPEAVNQHLGAFLDSL